LNMVGGGGYVAISEAADGGYADDTHDRLLRGRRIRDKKLVSRANQRVHNDNVTNGRRGDSRDSKTWVPTATEGFLQGKGAAL
jgi:hypothetical protein